MPDFRTLRHNARIAAVQELFLHFFNSNNREQPAPTATAEVSELTELNENGEPEEHDLKFTKQLVSGVLENQTKLDELITKLATDWPIEQIARIDLQILRIAIYEGFVGKLTPEKVAVDEAIELTKEFSNDQSRKFISGVLGNLLANRDQFLPD